MARIIFPALLLLLFPRAAWALQTHGYQGLYFHQGAHLLFLAAMVAFAYRLRVSRLTVQTSWRWLFRGALLISLWNLWAFIGHLVALTLPQNALVTKPGETVPSLHVVSWVDVAYYFLSMDHLLSVPALVCFYLGLREMHRTFPQRDLLRERRRHERRRVDRRLV
ncbi:MAG: hypothetical protein M0017_08415 [Desulfobacteraceae bacterium]|nr:hypothetical protein [Desulfobacteraceae bacterium]